MLFLYPLLFEETNLSAPSPVFSLPLSMHSSNAGQEPNDSVVDGMMSEAPGPLNFTMFLTLFGEKLTGERV